MSAASRSRGNLTRLRALDTGPVSYTNGKYLPNRPGLEAHARLSWTGDGLSAFYEYDYVSGNYWNAYNGVAPNNRGPLFDIRRFHAMGATVPTGLPRASFTLEVRNLTGEQAEDVMGYPMPGRSVFGTITVELLTATLRGSTTCPKHSARRSEEDFSSRRSAVFIAMLLAPGRPVLAGDEYAFVITTDYYSAAYYSTVEVLPPRAADMSISSVNTDAVAYYDQDQDMVFVVNRYLADNIQLVDPNSGFATVGQYSVGNGSNPHDIRLAGAARPM